MEKKTWHTALVARVALLLAAGLLLGLELAALTPPGAVVACREALVAALRPFGW